MWSIQVNRRIRKEIESLDPSIRSSIEQQIIGLRAEPRPHGAKKMIGYANCWRLRVGRYRVLYKIFEKERIVLIQKIGHRKDVYRILQSLKLL